MREPPDLVLGRLAAEVESCHGLLLRLEAVLVPTALPEGEGRALQDIDLLGQSLDDIARCLHRLAGALPEAPEIDLCAVLAGLHLDDLARRLGGQTTEPVGTAARIALF